MAFRPPQERILQAPRRVGGALSGAPLLPLLVSVSVLFSVSVPPQGEFREFPIGCVHLKDVNKLFKYRPIKKKKKKSLSRLVSCFEFLLFNFVLVSGVLPLSPRKLHTVMFPQTFPPFFFFFSYGYISITKNRNFMPLLYIPLLRPSAQLNIFQ